ncbi:MAG: hypothetical protein EZS28_022457 [Streblomastix strix]|uniref:Uncharacterized protein n=1 Tax=Streblomastix strix TaxID=222440 RepID=A0A5J4VHE0_9EUKA|nr:MAG: hypothetical protein EZS28_022457 [Streblomastix strix]
MHSLLSSYKYVQALILNISTSGGYGDESTLSIYTTLENIYNFLNILESGRLLNPHSQQGNNLSLICHEQIEEEGGNEEIEAHLANQRYNYGILTQRIAKLVKCVILNINEG